MVLSVTSPPLQDNTSTKHHKFLLSGSVSYNMREAPHLTHIHLSYENNNLCIFKEITEQFLGQKIIKIVTKCGPRGKK